MEKQNCKQEFSFSYKKNKPYIRHDQRPFNILPHIPYIETSSSPTLIPSTLALYPFSTPPPERMLGNFHSLFFIPNGHFHTQLSSAQASQPPTSNPKWTPHTLPLNHSPPLGPPYPTFFNFSNPSKKVF